MQRRLAATFLLLASTTAAMRPPARPANTHRALSRRAAAIAILGATTPLLPQPQAGFAFDNGVAELALYAKNPKVPGQKPPLGLQEKTGKLGVCDFSPNCFSTSGDETHLLTRWKPKAGISAADAMDELLDAIKAYRPGQSGVDGGGFKIIEQQGTSYLYVQYESLKFGYIDDVEFSVGNTDEGVQVRSASREGYLDFGVNAKRLNFLSAALRSKGWDAPAITKKTHSDYFYENRM